MGRLVEQLIIENYGFIVELDTGGAPGDDLICWVSKDEVPLLNESGSQVTKYFPREKFNKRYFVNFCRKFVNDETYRNSYL